MDDPFFLRCFLVIFIRVSKVFGELPVMFCHLGPY